MHVPVALRHANDRRAQRLRADDNGAMAANVSRWMKYAKARLDAALGQGHDELDRLEAEREAELADKPWLRSEGDAPSFDEARARIEWEAERQHRLAEQPSADDGRRSSSAAGVDSDAQADDDRRTGTGSDRVADPLETSAEAAARESARVELEERQRLSATRLDEIRRELGIEADEPVEESAPSDDDPASEDL